MSADAEGERASFPVAPDTVTVLGSRWRAAEPAWWGLDFNRANLRTQSTLMLRICGKTAPYDLHLDVPFCHPDDQPEGWDDDMWYRVRPIAEPGKRWRGRLIRTVTIEPAPDDSPSGWRVVVEFAGHKRLPLDPGADDMMSAALALIALTAGLSAINLAMATPASYFAAGFCAAVAACSVIVAIVDARDA